MLILTFKSTKRALLPPNTCAVITGIFILGYTTYGTHVLLNDIITDSQNSPNAQEIQRSSLSGFVYWNYFLFIIILALQILILCLYIKDLSSSQFEIGITKWIIDIFVSYIVTVDVEIVRVVDNGSGQRAEIGCASLAVADKNITLINWFSTFFEERNATPVAQPVQH